MGSWMTPCKTFDGILKGSLNTAPQTFVLDDLLLNRCVLLFVSRGVGMPGLGFNVGFTVQFVVVFLMVQRIP